MAYLRDLDQRCRHEGCPRIAKVELINRVNSPQGRYCGTHAKAALRDDDLPTWGADHDPYVTLHAFEVTLVVRETGAALPEPPTLWAGAL